MEGPSCQAASPLRALETKTGATEAAQELSILLRGLLRAVGRRGASFRTLASQATRLSVAKEQLSGGRPLKEV